ncbi:MAG: chemotaxis protein CheB [Candidatus Odinarchaeota archaeon]
MLKKVLIASESILRRNVLSEMLSSHSEIKIEGIVRNGQEAINNIKTKEIDVLILDIEYKNKEWLASFNLIANNFNIPIIVLTDINPKVTNSFEIPIILKSYDYIVKPIGLWKEVLPKIKENLISKVLLTEIPKKQKIDSKSRLLDKNNFVKQGQKLRKTRELQLTKKFRETLENRAEEFFLEMSPTTLVRIPTRIVVIGASVGGPRTLRTILSDIPANLPVPILVVQHLNHLFMRQFVMTLKDICQMEVKIGANYEEITPGTIYFSPGDKHMQVTVKNNTPCIRTFEGELVNFCRPSVDVLFFSTARVYKDKTLGILLTGMGSDGAAGLMAIRREGGKTIAESEETSVLYGMPRVAAEIGAANLIIPNYKIVNEIIKFVG